MGLETLAAFTTEDEQEALIEFERTEAINEDSNILTDSYDTYKIVIRELLAELQGKQSWD